MNDDSQLSFGQWLRRRRRALDLTQVELAARVPCAKGTIRRIEADDLRPSKALAERLAAVLQVEDSGRAAFVGYARGGLPAAAGVQPLTPAEPPRERVAPPTQTAARRLRLPEELSALFGRQHTAEVAVELLARPDVRLVTLVGPPGVGKTRLARAIGAQTQSSFRDGACFVELAPLRSREHVLLAIAQAIELADSGAPLHAALAERLRSEELLLILDNLEHVLDAAPAISALLAASAALKILCTSRVPLRVTGEHEFVVPPLALPNLTQHIPSRDLEASPAVALFLARARTVLPAIDADPADLRKIAEICHRLDGLPLAIELAAHRVKLFTPAALLGRLDRRLPLLTGGARDAPARQQTLEAAIAWSYDLLDAAERRCLARLAIFSGGATFEAVEAVCGGDLDVLAALTALVDHSLLQSSRPESGEVRFTLLETIREFALARLEEQGDGAAVRERHARHYLRVAVDAERGLQGAEQVRWMQRLNDDENNLRAAFAWSLAPEGDTALGLRAAAGLWWWWWTGGQVGEGRRQIESLLRCAHAHGLAATADDGRARLGAGILAFFGGDFAAALPHFTQARSIGTDVADTITHGYATFMVGTVMVLTDRRPEGYALLEEGLRVMRGAGDAAVWQVGVTSLARALLLFERGDLDEAQRSADAGMAIFRRLGQPYGIGLAHNYQGDIARLRGQPREAAAHYHAALPLLREAHARSEVPAVLHNLGHVAVAQGDSAQARTLFAEGFELHREIGNRMGVAECLIGLAVSLHALGRAESAALLLGALDAALASLNVPLFAAEQAILRRAREAVRAALDAETWEAALLRGHGLTPAEAVHVADASADA